jgi:hypothetical protein
MESDCLSCIEQEQLAAQVVAVMDAHFHRPTAEEKNRILELAAEQISAEQITAGAAQDTGEQADSDTAGEESR